MSCDNCKAEILNPREGQKFCCPKCRYKWHNKRKTEKADVLPVLHALHAKIGDLINEIGRKQGDK